MTAEREGRAAWGAFALLLACYVLTFSGRYHSSDEMSMLAATDSLARRGAWDIDLLRWMGEQQGELGPDGHLYSHKGIGTTLAALPLYWAALHSEHIGNVQAAMLLNGVVTALTGALLLLFVRRLGYSLPVAAGTALAYGLATMAWPYARYLFSEPLAGLGLVAGAYFLLRYRDCGDAASLLLAGAGLALALLTRLNNGIAAPILALVLAAYLFRRLGGPRRAPRRWLAALLVFALPVAVALGVTAWYNWLRFGSPLATGYFRAQETFSGPLLRGLYGLLLSPGKGLLWYNPILFASLLAWPAFIRRHRVEGWLAAAMVAANVLFYAPWYLWWGGHAWGPRFLVTALPFAALPLAEALTAVWRARGRPASATRAALAALLLISVLVQLLGVAVNWNLYLEDVYGALGLYHPATLFDPAYSPLVRQIAYLRPATLDLAWMRAGRLNGPGLTLGLATVAAAALALIASLAPRFARPARARRGWIAATAALVVTAALVSLVRYRPSGDVAQAASYLTQLEQPGERAILADSLLTEPFQDAYDGHLPLWGVAPSGGEGADRPRPAWIVGADGATPAADRLQVGSVLLARQAPAGPPLPLARLQDVVSTSQTLGDRVELIAYDTGTVARPGRPLAVMLAWQATLPMTTSYTVFCQVIDGQGVKAGQVDRVPCNGTCPTTTWRAGDLVAEWLAVPIRADAAPGSYQIIAGLYDPLTGARLPIARPGPHHDADYISLGQIDVLPAEKPTRTTH